MKFIAALLISTVSAAAVADKASCATAGDTCTATTSCCGTVTGVGGPSTKVCSVKPTPAEDKLKGSSYIITAAVAAVAKTDTKAAVVEVKEVKGTFKCAAAGASYMAVGAAAFVAAATLLQ